jgi:hypothetical protein
MKGRIAILSTVAMLLLLLKLGWHPWAAGVDAVPSTLQGDSFALLEQAQRLTEQLIPWPDASEATTPSGAFDRCPFTFEGSSPSPSSLPATHQTPLPPHPLILPSTNEGTGLLTGKSTTTPSQDQRFSGEVLGVVLQGPEGPALALMKISGELLLCRIGHPINDRYSLIDANREGVTLRDQTSGQTLTLALPEMNVPVRRPQVP